MAVFPIEVFTTDEAIVGRTDPYKTSVLNKKFAGQPKGVYTGLIPSVSPPSPVLTLSIDPTEGFSCVKVPLDGDPGGLDVVIDQNITIDFTGQPAGDFPISVLAQATYTDDPATPTTASIITRTLGPTAFNEVLVTVVDGPSTSLSIIERLNHGLTTGGSFQLSEIVTGGVSFATATVIEVGDGFLLISPIAGSFTLGETITGSVSTVTATFVLQSRAGDIPLALGDVNFGFMPDGSIETLQTATDIVNEVIAARIGLDSTVYSDLSSRLAGDQTAESMASRLGLTFRALRSNDYSIAAGAETVIVSGSFSEIDRLHNPKLSLDGAGDESTVGAVAGPNDAARNICLIQDANSGYRPVDDPTDRRVVYGRLAGPESATVAGTWTFTNALRGVTATDGTATSQMQVGDTIEGVDGLFYEIETITDDVTIQLVNAYTGATATAGSRTIRRWTLALKKLIGGVETSASLPVPTTIRFFCPAFLSMTTSNFDYSLALHSASEISPLPDASETVPGAVRLSQSGALLGSVSIQNASVALGGGPFHTIDFNAPNASVIPGLSGPGEVEVAEIGPAGAAGAPGPSGGPGNPGPTGPGFSEINTFEASSEFAGAPVAVPFSFTRAMGHTIRNIEGGIARWRDFGAFVIGLDIVQIFSISGIGTTTGQLDGDIAVDTAVVVFLSSSGD